MGKAKVRHNRTSTKGKTFPAGKGYPKTGFIEPNILTCYKGILMVRAKDAERIKEEETRTGTQLTDVYYEERNPEWQKIPQKAIDFDHKSGIHSYVIHIGKMHYHFTNW